MTNTMYATAKTAILSGDVDLLVDDIRAVLIDLADYTPNFSTDDFLADVPGAAIIGTATALASKTITAGVFDAADTTISAVTGDQAEAVLLYKHTGSSATSQLLCLYDTGTGFPVTPNGGDILVQWDNGANKIFKI